MLVDLPKYLIKEVKEVSYQVSRINLLTYASELNILKLHSNIYNNYLKKKRKCHF